MCLRDYLHLNDSREKIQVLSIATGSRKTTQDDFELNYLNASVHCYCMFFNIFIDLQN